MPVVKEAPGIETRPVLDERGFVMLWDLFVGGQWVGSRRTVEQCEMWLTHYTGLEIQATWGNPW